MSLDPTPPAVPFPHNPGKRNSYGDEGGLGAVLAGGRGSRLGGAKATADLAGSPLISYPLAALAAAGLEPFVVAKPSTHLRGRPLARQASQGTTAGAGPAQRTTAGAGPDQRTTAGAGRLHETTAAGQGKVIWGVPVITEPEWPTHPLAGIVAALRHAGRPLVIVGCDFPFLPPALLLALAEAPEPLVVPTPGGDPQSLVARWSPELLPRLERALDREEPLRRTVASLGPRLLDDTELGRFGDTARAFFNVNTPADLARAAAFVARTT